MRWGRGATARLVSRHFPGLTVDAYAERFAALSHNVQATFGVDVGEVWGCSLGDLGSALGDLVTGRLEDRRRSLGMARFAELARLLALAWETSCGRCTGSCCGIWERVPGSVGWSCGPRWPST